MMDHTYWQKQTADKPLFPELLWSRPENKRHAGKLLIIGGNKWGFVAPATAYTEAVNAGIGTARVLLPEAVHKMIGHVMEHAESAASTPSGSFSKLALPEWLEQSLWADGVLLAGDLGRNSETAIVVEQFIITYAGQLTITKDAIDYTTALAENILLRPKTTLVLSLGQLQKLATVARFSQPITSTMDILRLVDALHVFTTQFEVNIVVKHFQNFVVASGGQVSSTKFEAEVPIWRVARAAHAAVWWLQNPDKPFESITISMTDGF
jgi:ADP-dependent NAD(P)H-hydrate dehydratase / NAD(P)H-hydrate epimerase